MININGVELMTEIKGAVMVIEETDALGGCHHC